MTENIFSSISLTFSLSLAFITWIILCYFKLIEDQRRANEKAVEPHKGFAILAPPSMPTCKDSSTDLYISFLWIFVCICALTKLMQCLEKCIRRSMQMHFQKELQSEDAKTVHKTDQALPSATAFELAHEAEFHNAQRYVRRYKRRRTTSPPPFPQTPATTHSTPITTPAIIETQQLNNVRQNNTKVENLGQDKSEMEAYIMLLEQRYVHMQKILEELQTVSRTQQQDQQQDQQNEIQQQQTEKALKRLSNPSIMSKNEILPSTKIHSTHFQAGTLSPTQQNIYINHNHIHISGPLYLNERTVNIQMPPPRLAFYACRSDSAFRQVWSKYIRGSEQRQPPMLANMSSMSKIH